MPVEFATVKRAPVAEQILVVGNLIGAATVEVVPRANGRLQVVDVKLGDPVRQGQVIARVEDSELREQVRGAEASYQVSQASIRQREADLKLAQNNLERSRSLYERQLLPQQTFDDVDARHQAAVAQLDLARAQFEQSKARLDELKITLTNTQIVSPVDGFIGKRYLDPGAFASTNAPVASVVDIRTVRMVANLVERDMRRVPVGTAANVEVDAYPGRDVQGPRQPRCAGLRSVHADGRNRDRSAERRLSPEAGHVFARAAHDQQRGATPSLFRATRSSTSTAGPACSSPRPPRRLRARAAGAAARTCMTAKFVPVEVGIRDGEAIEITKGLDNGARVITTGASALKDGDRIVAANEGTGRGRDGRGPSRRQDGASTGVRTGTQPQGSSR